jgi:hypothetical protein
MAVENRLKSQTILAIPGPQKTQKSNLWKTEILRRTQQVRE